MTPIAAKIVERIAPLLKSKKAQADVAAVLDEELAVLLSAVQTLAAHASWSPDGADDVRTAIALVQQQVHPTA